MSADPQLWSQLQHALQEIEADRVDLRENHAQVLGGVHLEVLLVLRVLGDPRPGALRRRAHDAEDPDELVFVRRAGEEGPPGVHLGHDAAGGPDVDAGVVRAAPEEDIRGAVPEGDDFVGEGVDGYAKGARKTEIRELELAFDVDEQILGLQVAVQDSVRVAEIDAQEELVHEGLDRHGG